MRTIRDILKRSITICLFLAVSTAVNATQVDVNGDVKVFEAFHVNVVGEGKPVFLIPGISSSAEVWEDTVGVLKGHYQLHVFNLAGFAGVPAVSTEKLGTSVLTYQKNAIRTYIEEQELEDVVIVGHSLGGFLSLWLAAEQTEQVRAIVNVDGLPALGALFSSMQNTQDVQNTPRNFDPVAMVKGMANNTSWHQRILSDMSKSDQMTSGRAMGELMQLDIRAQLVDVKIPTLTIGAPSQGLPYTSYEQSKRNYLTQLNNIPLEHRNLSFAKTSRHFVMADEPEWMNQQIKAFLDAL